MPVLSKFYHAHLPLQTCRAIPTLTDLTTLVSPNRSSPAFPFNYGPCHVQSLPFQFATRLTCLYLPSRALTIPDTPHLACLYSPCSNLLLAVLTHLACHASSTCPCQSPPHRSSPSSPYLPIRITRCLPPQTLPAPNAPRQSAFAIPCLLIRACFVFNGDYSSPLRTSILESTPWFQVKNLNYWLLIAFLK